MTLTNLPQSPSIAEAAAETPHIQMSAVSHQEIHESTHEQEDRKDTRADYQFHEKTLQVERPRASQRNMTGEALADVDWNTVNELGMRITDLGRVLQISDVHHGPGLISQDGH